jgi:succinate dehydrogenase / fumarate reductase, cytochrome b subunit
MTKPNRPLSPHLQIYRPQLTSVLSILHRLTGIALSAGMLLVVWLVVTLHQGHGHYWVFQDFIGSFIGRLLLFGWTWAVFFHLLNGVRHLAWDAGLGFELKTVYASGWAVVIGSVILTVAVWIAGFAVLLGSRP